MSARLSQLGVTALLVVGLTVLAVPAVTAQDSSTLSLSIEASEAAAGENVTVTFTLENTGDEPTAAILDVSERPDDWEMAGHENDGGVWQGDDEKWLFQTVEAGGAVEPSITLTVPEDASGEFTIAGNVSETESSTTAETTLTIGAEETETEASGDGDDGGDGGDEGTTNLPGPGFGVVGAIAALLAVALLARRR